MPAIEIISKFCHVFQILCVKPEDNAVFFTSACTRSDGCLMVINGGSNRIIVYSAGGQIVQSNFGNRLLNKRFQEPSLITETPNKRIVVFDRATNQLKKLSYEEDFIATFDIGLPSYSLTTNNYGHLIMAHQKGKQGRLVTIRDSDNGYVIHSVDLKMEPNTVPETPFYAAYRPLTCQIATLCQSSCQLAIRNIYGEKDMTMGKQGFVVGHMDNPSSLCLDSKGRVIVADTRNNRILRYKCDKSLSCEVLLSDIHRPLCVRLDKYDQLIVMAARCIQIYGYDLKRPAPYQPVLINGI